MKSKLLTLVLLAATSFFCQGQTPINSIDKSVQDIKTNLSLFKKVEKIDTKDGTSFVFFQDQEIKLITVKALEPTTEKNVEWYFVDGQLAYCETNWLDTKTKTNVFNEKCYLHNGHLISWANSRDNTIDPSSEKFIKMDADLVANGIKIKEGALK